MALTIMWVKCLRRTARCIWSRIVSILGQLRLLGRNLGKELVLDQNKISVKDRSDKGRCAIQDTLSLHQALQRRALACDLMSACSYEALHEWHSFMLERLQQSSSTQLRETYSGNRFFGQIELRGSDFLKRFHTLKPNASGALPLDAAIADLHRDPTVLFHLLNVREVRTVEAPRVPPKKEDKSAKLDNKRKPEELKKNKQDPNKSQKAELPDELKAIPGLNLATAEGEKSSAGHTTVLRAVGLRRQERPAVVASMLA